MEDFTDFVWFSDMEDHETYNCLIQWAYYCKLAGTPKNLPNDFRESHRQLGESIINILADFMGQKMARKAVKNFIDVSLINKS